MMELLYGIIGVLFGGAVTYLVQRLENRRQSRSQLAHELYLSWQSDDMVLNRVIGMSVLAANLADPTPRTFQQLASHLRTEGRLIDWIHVTRVLHFFEKCAILANEGVTDKNLTRRLLGRYVQYWVDRYMEPLWRLSTGVDDEVELHWYELVPELRASIG